MITVSMEYHSEHGPSKFRESFLTSRDALAYIGGYIGAHPINIDSFTVEGNEGHE